MKKKLFFALLLSLALVVLPLAVVTLIQLVLLKLEYLPRVSTLFTSRDIALVVGVQFLIFVFFALLLQRFFQVRSFSIMGKDADGSVAELRVREVLLVLGGLLAVNLLSRFLTELLHIEVAQFEEFDRELLKKDAGWFMLSVALLAPFYEEYVFRGLVLPAFLQSEKPGRWQMLLAIVVSSLLFTAIHFDRDAAVPIFILALYLALLTLYKKGLILSILAHSMQNFISALVLLYGPRSGF